MRRLRLKICWFIRANHFVRCKCSHEVCSLHELMCIIVTLMCTIPINKTKACRATYRLNSRIDRPTTDNTNR